METLRIGHGVPARARRGWVVRELLRDVLLCAVVIATPIAVFLAISEAVIR